MYIFNQQIHRHAVMNTKMMHAILLCFSKIKNMAFQPSEEIQNTIVAEVSSWSPANREDILFMLYDVGGQKSYKNTAHLFQVCITMITFNQKQQHVELTPIKHF